MPKRSKPRKPNSAAKNLAVASSASPRSAKRQKVVKYAAIAIIIALVATVLIGALGASPSKAAELMPVPTPAASTWDSPAQPDTDGDGIPNNADPDIDGDGIVNGLDPDIDGDGIPNAQDSDPAGTLTGVIATKAPQPGFELPRLIPAEFETPTGRISIAAVILLIGAAIVWARRRHK